MNNQSRIDLLKEVKSAVNTASFAPTAERIADAKRQVSLLMSYVESLEAPKRKKPQKKASTKRSSQREKMLEMIEKMLTEGKHTFNEMSHEERLAAGQESASYEADLDKPKAKRRRKTTKQKSGKATAATRIADRQERAYHGKADTPVTPRHTKRTASVEEARKAAKEVSDKTGATARAERKAKALKEAVAMPSPRPLAVTPPKRKPSKKAKNWTKGVEERTTLVETTFLPTPVTSPDEARLADLEAKIDALIALQSMGHDVTRSAEVLFSDLPFDPTSTL